MQHLECRLSKIAAQLEQAHKSKEEMEDILSASVSRARFDDLQNRWENAENKISELELEVGYSFFYLYKCSPK